MMNRRIFCTVDIINHQHLIETQYRQPQMSPDPQNDCIPIQTIPRGKLLMNY